MHGGAEGCRTDDFKVPQTGVSQRPASLTNQLEHSISSHIKQVYQQMIREPATCRVLASGGLGGGQLRPVG